MTVTCSRHALQFGSAGTGPKAVGSAVVSGLAAILLVVSLTPANAYSQTFRPGDHVQLSSGDTGIIDSIENGVAHVRVEVRMEVPLYDLKPLTQPASSPAGLEMSGRPGAAALGIPSRNKPLAGDRPDVAQIPLAGSWIAADRALVIRADGGFRLLQTDEQQIVRVNFGTWTIQTIEGGPSIVDFASDGEVSSWKLIDIQAGQSLVMEHDEAGRRLFQAVATTETNTLAGNWSVNYTRTDGRYGTAKMGLYRDGTFVIDELDENGRFDHREYGSWQTEPGNNTMTITFPHRGQLHTVVGRINNQGPDQFSWNFETIYGLGYKYSCRRAR